MSMMRGWLKLQWWCARVGFARAVTVLICLLAVGVGGGVVPHLRQQEKADHSALSRARYRLLSPEATGAVSATPTPDHLAMFYDALGESRHAEQQLKTLFDLAQKNNVRLSTAQYKSSADENSRVRALQITLPVKAAYPAIRQFAEQVLLAIPFASLDELRFKRDSIASPLLEAHLRFSLHLLETPRTPLSHWELVP